MGCMSSKEHLHFDLETVEGKPPPYTTTKGSISAVEVALKSTRSMLDPISVLHVLAPAANMKGIDRCFQIMILTELVARYNEARTMGCGILAKEIAGSMIGDLQRDMCDEDTALYVKELALAVGRADARNRRRR